MAWSSSDQNPSMSPSASYGQTNYAAQLNNAAYYNPMGSGSTMAPTGIVVSSGSSSIAPSTGVSSITGETNYADRLSAAAPAQAPQSVSAALAKSATPQPAVGTQAAREIQPWGGGGSRFEIAGRAAERGIGKVDDALVDIIQKAAEGSNYNVQLFSGYRPGDRRQHGRGNAVDIALVDPYSGEALPNYQSAETFPQYETFARSAYEIAKRDYPELADSFRWGGYFGGGKGKYGANDAMHFDVGSRLGMAGGSFEDGLTPDQQRRVDRMGVGRTQWAGLRPGTTEAPPATRYAGNPLGVGEGRDTLAGGTSPPLPRMRPDQTQMAYAPPPEAMQEGPFDAVLAASRDRRPQPPTPQASPRRDRLQAPAAAPQGGNAYVVQRGDNLTKIGQQFGVSPQEIARANGIRDINRIAAGQQLVIPRKTDGPAREEANVPAPRMRPSREVAMPTPPTRPDMRIERYKGGAPDAGTVPNPRMRSQPPARSIYDDEPAVRWQERLRRPGPVIPRTGLETAEHYRNRADMSLVTSDRIGTPETQMSIDRPIRATTGMDTSGLIREPTAQERALQGQPMRLPTGAQPIDPRIASQIRMIPTVITDPRYPPIYTSPSGVRVWAVRQ
jgi:LysM repeat protein